MRNSKSGHWSIQAELDGEIMFTLTQDDAGALGTHRLTQLDIEQQEALCNALSDFAFFVGIPREQIKPDEEE